MVALTGVIERCFLLILLGRGGGVLKRFLLAWREALSGICLFQEMSMLTGWRLSVSIVLEALDAVTPLLSAFFNRLGDLVSFLLVSLVGRALGLIFKGVKSSLTGETSRRKGREDKRLWV